MTAVFLFFVVSLVSVICIVKTIEEFARGDMRAAIGFAALVAVGETLAALMTGALLP